MLDIYETFYQVRTSDVNAWELLEEGIRLGFKLFHHKKISKEDEYMIYGISRAVFYPSMNKNNELELNVKLFELSDSKSDRGYIIFNTIQPIRGTCSLLESYNSQKIFSLETLGYYAANNFPWGNMDIIENCIRVATENVMNGPEIK